MSETPALPPDRTNTTILAIFASVFLLSTGSAAQGTAITLRAALEGFSDSWIGLTGASYFAGMLGGSFLALLVIRNVGYVRSFAAFASLASATSLAHLLVIGPLPWVIFRLIHGVCVAVVLVVVESWLNASAPNGRRGQVLSWYGLIYLAASGVGQPLIGVFRPGSFEIFALTSILISLCVMPISLAQVSGDPRIASVRVRVLGMFRKSPLGVTGVIVNGVVMGAHITLAPRYVQDMGLTEGQIGFFLLIVSAGTMAMQIPLGWVSDNRDRRLALLVSSSAGAGAALILGLVGTGGFGLLAVGFLFGGFALPLYSLALATVNDQLVSEELVEAASALYIFFGAGSVVGPLIASALMQRVGPGALYPFIAAVQLIYLLFGVLRVRLVPDFVVRGRSGTYRTMPRTTIAAFALLKKRTSRPPKTGTP